MNWHASMISVTFILALVASCTDHDLTHLTCCNLHFSIVLGASELKLELGSIQMETRWLEIIPSISTTKAW
jgi:hypothetical protein